MYAICMGATRGHMEGLHGDKRVTWTQKRSHGDKGLHGNSANPKIYDAVKKDLREIKILKVLKGGMYSTLKLHARDRKTCKSEIS